MNAPAPTLADTLNQARATLVKWRAAVIEGGSLYSQDGEPVLESLGAEEALEVQQLDALIARLDAFIKIEAAAPAMLAALKAQEVCLRKRTPAQYKTLEDWIAYALALPPESQARKDAEAASGMLSAIALAGAA